LADEWFNLSGFLTAAEMFCLGKIYFWLGEKKNFGWEKKKIFGWEKKNFGWEKKKILTGRKKKFWLGEKFLAGIKNAPKYI